MECSVVASFVCADRSVTDDFILWLALLMIFCVI